MNLDCGNAGPLPHVATAGYGRRSPGASRRENAGLSRCPSPARKQRRENQGHETDRFAAAQPRVS